MTAPARIQLADHVHLGFAVGTGDPVVVPVQHLAVTGQTQAAGKTTTIEALVARSGRRAIAFVTKRHEGSFRGDHHRVAPYFRERADWQFVQAILEATMRERMRFERAWIMRASKGAKTLADVRRNVQRLMDRSKGLSADVYMQLDAYLEIVVPQIDRLPYTSTLWLARGLNVMDVSAYTGEMQALVIRSVIESIYENARDTLVVIPEAWEFVPQARGSPVLLAAEQLVRKGGAGGNFVWLDSQDIAGVHKNILRSVGVWLLGVQREANEVRRALAHIPGKKPTVTDVMELQRGQFFVCHGRTVVKTFVQPIWMSESLARLIALGKAALPLAPESTPSSPPPTTAPSPPPATTPPSSPPPTPSPPTPSSPTPSTPTTPPPSPTPTPRMEDTVNEAEARELREQNEQLKARVRVLESELRDIRDTYDPPDAARAPALGGKMPPGNVETVPPDARLPDLSLDSIYRFVKERLLTDPKMIALTERTPEIEVTHSVERIRMDTKKQPGLLAAMIAKGYFAQPVAGATVVEELKRRGRSVHHANVYRDLNQLTEQGFLTKEDGGYQAVPGMKINIVEA